MKNFKAEKLLTDIIYFILGAAVYSVAVNTFLYPSGISPGGFTGIATVINFLTTIPVGTLLFVLNAPILILGFIKIGGKFILKTAAIIIIFSVVLDLSAKILPVFKGDNTLSALFGGISMGFGLSLILLRGATTGGVDIIAKLINRKFRHLSVGKIIFISDFAVIILNSLIYKNVESALYSIVAIYVATRVMDLLICGADKGKIIYIITDKPDIICKKITDTVNRGVTKISVKGGYTSQPRTMIMCSVRINEVGPIIDIIKEYDEKAFSVITDATEILGNGFKMYDG